MAVTEYKTFTGILGKGRNCSTAWSLYTFQRRFYRSCA